MQAFYGLLFVISLYELAGIYLSDLQMVTLVSPFEWPCIFQSALDRSRADLIPDQCQPEFIYLSNY